MSPLKLEVFETEGQRRLAQTIVLDSGAMEEARLQSYELGYAAGWEDAAAAARQEQGRLGQELANNLQQLAFTFQEARLHVVKSVRPVLAELCTRMLPQLAREALAPVVLDALMPLVDDLADSPVRIVLNPAARPAVERLVATATGLPLRIEEEPTLGEGQVYLRLGDVEERVDLDAAAQEIMRAVRDFFACADKEADNG